MMEIRILLLLMMILIPWNAQIKLLITTTDLWRRDHIQLQNLEDVSRGHFTHLNSQRKNLLVITIFRTLCVIIWLNSRRKKVITTFRTLCVIIWLNSRKKKTYDEVKDNA